MTDTSKADIIARAAAAERALVEVEPYFRAVEALYVEQLIAVSGWRAWWRGDRRRAEAAARIKALREVRRGISMVIQEGKLRAAPPRKVGV